MTKKEKARASRLLRVYNLTVEKYDEILASQGGGCAICGKTPEEEGKHLAVDHLHHPPWTVRGVLCTYCNHRVVGRHRDPDLLRKVADYLERDYGVYAPPPSRKRRRKGRRKAKK